MWCIWGEDKTLKNSNITTPKTFKLLSLLLFLCAVPIISQAQTEGQTQNYFEYEYAGTTLKYTILTDSTVSVGKDSTILSGQVIIPDTAIYIITNTDTNNIITDIDTTYYIVKTIRDSAFYNCSNLTSVTIPNSVTSIGESAFQGCSGLLNVTIPNSVTSMGESVFQECSSLLNVTIPNSVTSIGSSAFSRCYGLLNVTIPNSVISIGVDAFYNCSNLTSITIPNSVTSIGNYAFYRCSSLLNVTIPNSVRSIGNGAFEKCTRLTSITIPNSVTSISNFAFYDCSSLTDVTIPNSVTSIGNGAFFNCSKLTSVTIPNSVTFIDIYAFSGCSGLLNVTIPNSVTSIGSYAFNGCSGLLNVTIPNSVTSIGSYAFNGCSGLLNVTIPNSVTSIGSYAFQWCSGLLVLNYNAEICTEASQWFSNCNSLCKVNIGNRVRYIPSKFLSKVCSVQTITIPDSVISIGNEAFYNCTNLTTVTIGRGVTGIGSKAFYNCYNLRTLNYNAENCNIDQTWLENCNNLNTVKIGDSVRYIPIDFLNGKTSVNNVTIGSSVNNIDFYAFRNCTGLESITSHATNVPTAQFGAFQNIPDSIPVIVPCGSQNNYRNADNWSNFTNIRGRIAQIDSISSTICSNETYNFHGTILDEAGVYTKILQGSNDCDSVVVLTLNTKPAYSDSLNVTICANETYNFNGTTLNTSGIYTSSIQGVNGCDSTIVLTLNVEPDYATDTTNVTLCYGETYNFNGTTLSTTGTYLNTFQSVNGCDSVIAINLTVLPLYDTTIYINQVIDESGSDYYSTYTDLLQSVDGCDSTVRIITYNDYYDTITLYDTINTTDTLIVNNYDTITLYDTLTLTEYIYDTINTTDTLIVNNYDTITLYDTLTLTEYDTVYPCARVCTYIYATINQGETYDTLGFNANSTGTYRNTYTNSDGCDSVAVLYLSVVANSGINEIQSARSVILYPNPANDMTRLSLNNIGKAKVNVCDMQGRTIASYDIAENQTDLVIETSTFAKGSYMIIIQTDKQRINKKLIVE